MSDWTTSLEDLLVLIDVAGGDFPDTDLLNGADSVEGCIERAVAGELDPTGNLALGRYPPFLSPGAGAWLAKKGRYDAQDPESRAVLGRAVTRTLGVGWLLAATGGLDVAEPRDERSVYAIWAPSFADPIVNVSDKETQRTVDQAGSNIFIADLREAGMTKLLGGSKLNQVGSVIAGGGFLLRLTQSTMMGDTEFTEAAARWSADSCPSRRAAISWLSTRRRRPHQTVGRSPRRIRLCTSRSLQASRKAASCSRKGR